MTHFEGFTSSLGMKGLEWATGRLGKSKKYKEQHYRIVDFRLFMGIFEKDKNINDFHFI